MAKLSTLKILAGDSLIYGVSGVVSRFISIFLVPVYTRIFTPSDYGVISLVSTFFALLSILVILSLDNSVARWYYDDETENERKISLNTFLWSCLAVSIFISVLIIIFRDFVAVGVLQEQATFAPLLIAAVNLPLTVFVTFTTNLLRIQRRAAAASVFSISIALTTIALNVLFVVIIKTGVIGVFYAQLLTSIGASVWTLILFSKTINPRFFDFTRWKEMFWFSFPLIPGSVAFWVINFSGVYFIQSFENAREVGLYQIGISVASAMALLTNAFQMAWGPFAFSIHKQTDAKEIYADALLIYVGITSTVAIFITLFAREVLMILTVKDYYGAFLVAGILSFNYLFIGLAYIASIGTSLAKNNKAYGIASLFSAVLLVVLSLILVPKLGKEGAALATLGSQIIIPVAIFWHSQIIYPIPYKFAKSVFVILSSVVSGFGTLFILNESALGFYVQVAVKITVAIVFTTFLALLLNAGSQFPKILAKLKIK